MYKKYGCSYDYEGQKYWASLYARDIEEAEERLTRLAWGKVEGEIVGTFKYAWMARLATWMLNKNA